MTRSVLDCSAAVIGHCHAILSHQQNISRHRGILAECAEADRPADPMLRIHDELANRHAVQERVHRDLKREHSRVMVRVSALKAKLGNAD